MSGEHQKKWEVVTITLKTAEGIGSRVASVQKAIMC